MKSHVKFDELGYIMAYENGDMTDEDMIILFQHLVDNGHAWTLQGHYGREAKFLIDAGVVKDTHHLFQKKGHKHHDRN